jgi:hypothetical protein
VNIGAGLHRFVLQPDVHRKRRLRRGWSGLLGRCDRNARD